MFKKVVLIPLVLALAMVSFAASNADADTFVVVMSEDGALLQEVSYGVSASGVVQHVICNMDVPGANYNVYRNDALVSGSPFTVDESGTLSFVTSGGGSFDVTAGPPPQDTSPPYTTLHSPAPGSSEVPRDTDITFHVKDQSDGVNLGSIAIRVNGADVAPTISGNTFDYQVNYSPATPFAYGEVVTVAVDCQDLHTPPNIMDTYVYSFTIAEPDTTPPAIVSASAEAVSNVDVVFSEPVETSSAQNTANYSISPFVAISNAVLDQDEVTVHLYTGVHTEGVTYSVAVSNVRDQADTPNTILPGSSADYAVQNLVPSVPTGLNAVGGNGSIVLSWNDNPELDVLGYKVYYGVSSGVEPHMVEDFEGAPSDPDGWDDTGANNSQSTDDSLFKTFSVGGTTAFGTSSTASNIHSHYVDDGSITWSDYEYSGRMRITDASGGIGVTFLSQYANDLDRYYRLRRYGSYAFHISPHGTDISGGVSDTGVLPQVNVWYLFRIQVEDTGTRTDIRAKVWQEGQQEPSAWQVDCYDSSSTRLTTGSAGLWAYSSGSKYWDDLEVTGGDGSPPFEPPINVGDATSYNLTGLTNGVEYQVAVAAYDAEFESGMSDKEFATPTSGGSGDTTPPQFTNLSANPSGLSAEPGHNASTITFTASEDLLVNPSVHVDARTAQFISKDGNVYTYAFFVNGTEPEGLADVIIVGTDVAGNVGTATCAGCILLDFTPPLTPGGLEFQ